MLNQLEERILKYLISKNTERSVPICFEDVSLMDAISAVKSLAAHGFVLSCCSLNGAAAILQQKGKYYFEQKEQQMYGAYYDKIKQIQEYITKLEKLKTSNNCTLIDNTIHEILNVYSNEIPSNTRGTISTSLYYMEESDLSNYYDIIDTVMGCLKKVLSETKIEASKQSVPQVINQITQNQSQTQNQSIEISLNQVIREVQNIGLSPEETLTLIKALNEFDAARKKKDRHSVWEKAKNVLKYIVDKTIEVGVAVLPYIVANLHF